MKEAKSQQKILFVANKVRSLASSEISHLVKKLMLEANMDKKLYPYNLKHILQTSEAQSGASKNDIRQRAGWKEGSRIFSARYDLFEKAIPPPRLMLRSPSDTLVQSPRMENTIEGSLKSSKTVDQDEETGSHPPFPSSTS
ncbi:MAG: hypothetical protein EZS28_037727 [Streblomastix strix]|uniref:Uncharacterized protein n=1 Tax=Streblomastix strix TaxID=222440 RepID=A0A5J4U7B6_9EUKA|nr:MAG: hypothetical protein EZS28_037727 [Streblomastix strix]